MSNRRRFIQQSAAAASALAFPLVAGAQPKAVKVGILHPVTGALAYSGAQCRAGALMAIEDINKTGIKALGGAKLEVMLGDAQSTPQAGVAEIEKMQPKPACSAVVGAFASADLPRDARRRRRSYDLPYVVDVGVSPTRSSSAA